MTKKAPSSDRKYVIDMIWKNAQICRDLASIERNFQRAHLPKKMLEKMLSGKILDVGCGMGFMVSNCLERGYEAFGLDLAFKYPRFRNKVITPSDSRARHRLIAGNAINLPFSDGSFNLVTNTVGPLSYAFSQSEARAMLAEQLRVVRKGGRIYISPVVVDGSHQWAYLLNYVDRQFALRFNVRDSFFCNDILSYQVQTKIYIIGQSWNNETQNHEIDGFVIITKKS